METIKPTTSHWCGHLLLPRHGAQVSNLHREFLDAKGCRSVIPDDGLEFKDVDQVTSDSDMEDLVQKPVPMFSMNH